MNGSLGKAVPVPPAGTTIALLLPSFLAMAWLVERARWFWSNNPDLNFGWVVLLLCAYLFYEAWETRPAVNGRLSWWALPFCLAGLGLLFLMQIYQAAMGSNAASTVGLALGVMLVVFSNLVMVFGWPGVRSFGMAYAFLLVAMPMPSAVHGFVVGGLQALVASINTETLNLMGIPAERVGSLIRLPAGTVGIDEACSGIRSLQSTLMATVFIGYLTLKRATWQVLLLLSGVALAVVGNIIRSLYLSLTANAKGVDAIAGVHDAAGWSILVFTTAGVVALAWLMNRLEKTTTPERSSEATPSAGGEPQ
ncbi:MAG: exosortase/archaeosortase family protein [Verrucomicrobiales bacterium]|nr:exosortase/archaeosortase family protein [Verrucomicrobiales bacterium]